MSLSTQPRHLKRYQQIGRLLIRHGRGDLVKASGVSSVLGDDDLSHGDAAAAEELTDELEAMGPTFVKLGQLMSSRVDLFSPAYVEALSRLQDDVEPFPYEEVERIVEQELGVKLTRVFDRFDEEPMAAASLGQVHRARVRTGAEVVVKVQRPGVREQVRDDMEVLTQLAGFVDRHSEIGDRYALSDLLGAFRSSLQDELDYGREARNLETVGRILADHEHLVVPQPHQDFTTSRVLTMDFVDGRKLTDLSPMAQIEVDGAVLADELFSAYLQQVLVEGLFHADPHPGNVLLTSEGKIALIDIGMVATVAPAARDRLVKLFLALADARPDEVARVARGLGEELNDFDAVRFERVVTDVVGRSADASMADIEVGALVLELTRRAAEAGLRMDPELVMLGKALLNLDQVAARLDPTFEPREALRRHTSELMRTSMKSSPASMMASMLEAKEFVEELPGRVNRAFDAVGSGRFELRVNAFDEDEFLRGLHKLANVIATAMILAAMILASAFLARSGGSQTAQTIALVVFVVSIVISLGMVARLARQTRHVRTRRR